MARSLTSSAGSVFGCAHAQARELAGHQPAVGVVEHGAHAHGAAAGIDLVVDELQLALDRRRRSAPWSCDGDALDLPVSGALGRRAP